MDWSWRGWEYRTQTRGSRSRRPSEKPGNATRRPEGRLVHSGGTVAGGNYQLPPLQPSVTGAGGGRWLPVVASLVIVNVLFAAAGQRLGLGDDRVPARGGRGGPRTWPAPVAPGQTPSGRLRRWRHRGCSPRRSRSTTRPGETMLRASDLARRVPCPCPAGRGTWGERSAARMPMIRMTTRSSIRVKALLIIVRAREGAPRHALEHSILLRMCWDWMTCRSRTAVSSNAGAGPIHP